MPQVPTQAIYNINMSQVEEYIDFIGIFLDKFTDDLVTTNNSIESDKGNFLNSMISFITPYDAFVSSNGQKEYNSSGSEIINAIEDRIKARVLNE